MKRKMRWKAGLKMLVIGLVASLASPTWAQINLPTPNQIHQLRDIQFREEVRFSERTHRISDLQEKLGLPSYYTDPSGKVYVLTDISEDLLPVYLELFDNYNSAITIGADALYPDGVAGYNLTGKGYTVHIWDGGQLLEEHLDYEGRVSNETGTDTEGHAAHVMGTIVGGGVVDSTARGIAYEAFGKAYSFNDNALTRMAELAADGELLVSNHSYGFVLGWGNFGEWFGPPNATEDYRFGKYTEGASQVVDEIAYNNPYYSIVWSAGNDRNQSGDGSHPPDGQYDCIGPYGTAKNNIVVGAVNQVLNYRGPSSVVMSNFSSWGPVDDGRVKPEIVAMGVGVRSTEATGERAYGTRNGTSMSAPAVAGGVLLLQQQHAKLYDSVFMTSAMVRALLAHTALEAGEEGPDYSYGFGLMNVEDAAHVIARQNGVDTLMIQDTLFPGEVHTYDVFPTGESDLVSTIAWIDPPGPAFGGTEIDADNLMLVNDLDLRIVQENTDVVQEPYILDPSSPFTEATTGDNFRDNIELIKLENPDPRNYQVQVSHKGVNLEGDYQVYSLVITTTGRSTPESVLYWRGLPFSSSSSWSLTSGGESAEMTPGENTTIILDENSTTDNVSIPLGSDLTVKNLFVYGNQAHALDLNGNTLTVSGTAYIQNPRFSITNGTLRFIGEGQESLFVESGALDDADVVFDADQKTWRLAQGTTLGMVTVSAGNFDVGSNTLTIDGLEYLDNGLAKGLSVQGGTIRINELLGLYDPNADLQFESANITFPQGDASLEIGVSSLEGATFNVEGGNVEVVGQNVVLPVVNLSSGQLLLPDGASVESFAGGRGAELQLEGGGQVTFTPDFVLEATAEEPFLLTSNSETSASFEINSFTKVCLENVALSNVNNSGEAIISLGEAGTQAGGETGWQLKACEDVLFPAYEVLFPCEQGITVFRDNSSGSPESYLWDFGDGNTSADASPKHTYATVGSYDVTLTVVNGDEEVTFVNNLDIEANGVEVPGVVASGASSLASLVNAATYQWFFNGDSIAGANERSYNHQGVVGDYQVMISNDTCSAISAIFPVEVASIPEALKGLEVYPNPAQQYVTLQLPVGTTDAQVTLLTLQGQLVMKDDFIAGKAELEVTQLPQGLYLLRISVPEGNLVRRLVIE
ncbi:MAG TPA: hypothetical protein DCE41_14290 [Cytophagales bacterium]|nr:hypothetical protein [Cytophagales bacterium]HAP61306.1 hypothetical protein [Cytophagales bacterium]